MATFLKTATQTLTTSGISGVLTRWPVYALAAVAVTGTLLEQSALHVGPLSVSQPVLVIIDPLASIILSVWLSGERFTGSPAKIAIAGRAPACGAGSLAVVFVLLAESVADALVGCAGLAVDAVGVDLEQDGDAVAGAAGDFGGGDPGVEP